MSAIVLTPADIEAARLEAEKELAALGPERISALIAQTSAYLAAHPEQVDAARAEAEAMIAAMEAADISMVTR